MEEIRITQIKREDLPDDYKQKSKDDWWKCSHCGKFHKGFPYRCPYMEKYPIREKFECGCIVILSPDKSIGKAVHICETCEEEE